MDGEIKVASLDQFKKWIKECLEGIKGATKERIDEFMNDEDFIDVINEAYEECIYYQETGRFDKIAKKEDYLTTVDGYIMFEF